jgi:hypothetical protein
LLAATPCAGGKLASGGARRRLGAGSCSPRLGATELGWARAAPQGAHWHAGCCSKWPSLCLRHVVVARVLRGCWKSRPGCFHIAGCGRCVSKCCGCCFKMLRMFVFECCVFFLHVTCNMTQCCVIFLHVASNMSQCCDEIFFI